MKFIDFVLRLKNPILNEKIKIKMFKKGTKSNNILILEGNSHTANFVPMVNSLNLKDDFYFEHKVTYLIRLIIQKLIHYLDIMKR